MAEVADQIVATDVSLKRLGHARYLGWDALNLQGVAGGADGLYLAEGTFEAGLAIAWFAHVPRQRRGEFLDDMHGAGRSGGAACSSLTKCTI